MITRRLASTLARLLAATACLGALPLAAHATPDFAVPAVTCVPGNTTTMMVENKPLTAGVVRKEGPNTPPSAMLMYYCPVNHFDFTTAQPSWSRLRMTFSDNTGVRGNATARLYAKSRAKLTGDPALGTTFQVAAVSSVPSTTVSTVSVPLGGTLDFHRFTYWIVLEVSAPATATSTSRIDIHELQLTD